MFGSPNNRSFGTPTLTFGSPSTPTSLFGSTTQAQPKSLNFYGFGGAPQQASAFGGQVQGTSVPFNAITGTDTMMKNGVPSPINTRHQCITCMKEYENKCLEELRFEDYQLGRKGSSTQQNNMFASSPAQPSTGLFSAIPAAGTSNSFGQRTSFGTTSSPSGGLFQNLNQPKTNFFSSTPTTSSTFGTSTFSFSNPSTQTSGIFGQSSNTTSTAGTLGTNTGFSFSQPVQPQQTLGLFGQKTLTAPVSSAATSFSGFGLPQNTTLNKPLPMFGTPNAAFGTANQTFGTTAAPTTGLFGSTSQQPAKPFSFNSFGTTPQPAFGGTGASTFSFNNPSSTANLGFTSTTPNFGASTSTGFAPFGTNSFSLGAPANTAFGTPSFSFNNPSSISSGFPFLNSGAQNQFGQMNMQQPIPPTGPVPFATTPYKDSPLFYNLITNRNLEDMTKPTNPLAQRAIKEASRRRASSNFTNSGHTANLKNLTFPVSKNQIFNKKNSIFDGFEEEDRGCTIDILSSKTSVKKLSIKPFNSSNRYSMPSLNSASISKATSSGMPNLNESGNFDVGVYENEVINRPYTSDGFSEMLNSRLDDSVATLQDYSINTSSGEFTNRFHVPSPDPSFNEGHSRDELSRNAYDGSGSAVPRPVTNERSCNLICNRQGYYCHPTISELDNATENGSCLVRGFVIGRHNYGQIKFLEIVNVAGINLDEIFFFRHKEVNVYPDDDNKPPVGQGFNVHAEIRMERVWPIDKDTRDPIKSPTKIRALNYEDKLKRSCRRLDAEFISYDHDTGVWVFRVLHFSKYSCVPEENEDDDLEIFPPPIPVPPTKGLGGISSHELKSGVILSPSQPQTSQQPFLIDIQAGGEAPSILKQPKSWSTNYHSTPMVQDTARLNYTTPKGRPKDQIQIGHDRELFMATGDNEIDMGDADMDYNPLTPSEVDNGDSDKESGVKPDSVAPSKHSLYGSIIREVISSPKLNLMKSILSREMNPVIVEDEGSVIESPPPNKKSRPPRISLSERNKIRFSDVGTRPRQSLSLTTASHERPEGIPVRSGSEIALRRTSNSKSILHYYEGIGDGDMLKQSSRFLTFDQRQQIDNEQMKRIPVRQYRKREELKREEVLWPTVSMFSDMKLIPASVSSRRRGSRVCFGPGGHFIRVKEATAQIEVLRLDSYAVMLDQRRSSFYRQAVEDQLDFQLKYQDKVFSTGNQFILEPGGNASSQIEFLQLFAQEQHTDSSLEHFLQLNDERQIWSLCKILWPKNVPPSTLSSPEFLANQREKLVRWFEMNCHMLFGDLFDTSDKSIKGYLMKGMKLEACEEGITKENLNLALCLAQDNGQTKSSCKYQVTQWEVEGADNFIPPDSKILYELCAGLAVWENLDFLKMTTSQWLQHFAIYLWYIAPPHETVQEIVTRYHSLIMQSAGTHSEEQSFPKEADSSLPNLCVHMLKAYTFLGYPLKNLLSPTTNNPDCLDYKLSWLLMLNMEQFGGYRIEQELKENITCGFAAQLEKLGMFQWSVYVAKHLRPSKNREIMIQRILERNLTSLNETGDEYFLATSLGIDYIEIYAAKALRAFKEGRSYHQLWYLLYSRNYDDAFKIFVKFIGENFFTEANINSWSAILDDMYLGRHQIYDWEKHGQCVHSLLLAVKHVRGELHKRSSSLTRPDIRRTINDMFFSLTRVQPKSSSEALILLELCLGAKNIIQTLLGEDFPVIINRDSTAQYPSLELLNTKSLREYFEEARTFFNDLNY